MKIAHIALACFYIEGWSYQENLLPKHHKKNGNDVYIISSQFDKDKKNQPRLRDAGEYVNGDGIPVTILSYAKLSFFQKLIRAKPVKGLYDKLCEINPDIIFVHGGQTYNVFEIIRYKKKNRNVKIFADQHGDYYNMPVANCGWKMKVANKYLARFYVRSLAKYVEKYWGVTPWRVDYLHNVYNISPQKTGLLVMGGDDDLIDFDNQSEIRKRFRDSLSISENDFLILSGGKIDKTKNIIELMHAVSSLKDCNVKLAIFGTASDDLRAEFDELVENNNNILSIGWLSNSQIIDCFLASDLVVFPGTHSVLWEQAVACGIPTIFKKWEGMQHVDVGGNCIMLDQVTVVSIYEALKQVIYDEKYYKSMKDKAINSGREEFLYSKIAHKSISR